MTRRYILSEENNKVANRYLDFRQKLRKSNITVYNEQNTLKKFGAFLGTKSFKNTSEEDLQNFFNEVDSFGSRDLYAVHLIQFFRWLFQLKRKEKPSIMEWYEFSTFEQKEKIKDPKALKNQLVTPDEYKKIIDVCRDVYGMWQALWETFYLSGGRVSEIQGMKIKDVEIEGNNVIVVFNKSKTRPREVPLPETPNLLIRWLNNHPKRNDSDSPLWISTSNRNFGTRLATCSIQEKFSRVKKIAGVKDTLTPHSFRKTRATIIFGSRTKDGGIKFDDKQISQFFGWRPHTVVERREQYDLRTVDELKATVFGGITEQIETFDTLKQTKEMLEQKHEKEINQLKKEVTELKFTISDAMKVIKSYNDNLYKSQP